jgi:hypothetical protein
MNSGSKEIEIFSDNKELVKVKNKSNPKY